MVKILVYTEDDEWVTQECRRTKIDKAEMRLLFKISSSTACIIVDWPQKTKEIHHIPAPFPFCIPLYSNPNIYLVKCRVHAKVPTGWINNKKLSWSKVKYLDGDITDIEEISDLFKDKTIRQGLQMIMEGDWKGITLERPEGLDISLEEDLEKELEYVEKSDLLDEDDGEPELDDDDGDDEDDYEGVFDEGDDEGGDFDEGEGDLIIEVPDDDYEDD